MDTADRHLSEHNTAMTKFQVIRRRTGRLGKQSGVALVTALLMLFVLSLVVAAMISTSQQEMWTNSNFRATTQARYVAEAGAQAAIYYLKNNWTVPSTSGMTLTTYPITFGNGNKIVMASSSFGSLSDTYSTFDSTSDTAYATQISTIQSTLQNTLGTAKIAVAAQLLYVNTSTNLTRWRITARGSVGNASSSGVSGGVGSGMAQVEEVVELSPGNASLLPVAFKGFNYGGFATANTCNSIYISGGSSTNAYSFSASSGHDNSPTMLNTGGSMATFGSATLIGSAYIMGNLYAPGYAKYDTTQGSNSIKLAGVTGYAPNGKYYNNNDGCASTQTPLYAEWISQSNSSGLDCSSASTSACANDPQPLPSAYTSTTYGNAAYPVISGTTLETPPANASPCTYGNLYASPPVCNGGSGSGSPNGAVYGYYNPAIILPPSDSAPNSPSSPYNYGQVTLGGSTTVTLQAGVYYFDTLTITGSASLVLPASGNVEIYILNASNSSTPLNFTGGSVTNTANNPAQLTFIYNGTDTVSIASISSNAFYGTFYAPNAPVNFSANGAIYGAVISKTISITSGGHLYYDADLASTTSNFQTYQPGSSTATYAITQFSWTPW